MLCIFSKVKAYLVQIGYGFDQNCLKELKHFRLVLMGEEVMKLMQPSMANLNSPLSRVVKDSTPSRRWILRCINFRIGESSHTGCPRMFYTQKCKILRIVITIKTIEFGILIYLSDRAVLLAFWRILNQGNRPNKTENTWHYVKRVIFCILIEVGKEGFMSYSA